MWEFHPKILIPKGNQLAWISTVCASSQIYKVHFFFFYTAVVTNHTNNSATCFFHLITNLLWTPFCRKHTGISLYFFNSYKTPQRLDVQYIFPRPIQWLLFLKGLQGSTIWIEIRRWSVVSVRWAGPFQGETQPTAKTPGVAQLGEWSLVWSAWIKDTGRGK